MSGAEVPPLVREALAVADAAGFGQSCSPGTGRLLHVLTAQVRSGRIGELGTGSGVGAAWMASALEPDAELVTVERDGALAHRAAELFGDLGNVTVIAGDWSELAAHAPFELVFCDTVVPKREQVDATIALLAKGGTIVLDDYAGLARAGDLDRDAWLHDPHLVTTEVLVSETEAVVVGVRR
ncbi:MAG: O-methyltransferase [Acidimicrobiia bacterium]